MKGRLIFLGLAACVLAAVLWWMLRAKAPAKQVRRKPLEPLDIAVATDLHYIAPELTDNGAFFTEIVAEGDGKVMAYSEELTEAFVQQLLEEKPAVLILSGDLTFNGEKQSHQRLAEKLRRLTDAGIRVLVLPGNHDLNNRAAVAFRGDDYQRVDSVTVQDFAAIYQDFGYGDALSRDTASLSYVAELSAGLRVLLLDVNAVEAPGAVTEETFGWAEEQLQAAADDGVRVLAVSHQTVLQHNSVFIDGFVITNRERLLAMYEKYGVLCNLSGHMHIQHTAVGSHGLPEIVTGALPVSPTEYGVLHLTDSKADYHTKAVDVSSWAQKKGKTDKNLLDFVTYAADFFDMNSRRQAADMAQGQKNADQLTDYFCALNAAYFAGRMDTVSRDKQLLGQWETQNSFAGEYLSSIAADIPKDFTRLSFDSKE